MSNKNNTKSKFDISTLDMKELSSHQKASLAQIYDGKNELMLQKLIDDDSSLSVPDGNGNLQEVSILAVLLENENIIGAQKDKLIQACAGSQDEEVKVRLAKDSATPLSIQEKLAQDPNGDIRAELIWRENPEVSILQILAQDENWAIRREVSKSKHSTPKILELFINETDDDVILEVLQNPNTTPEILNKFADKFIQEDGWVGEDGAHFNQAWNHKFLTIAVDRLLESVTNKEDLANNTLFNYIANDDEEMHRVVLAKRDDVPVTIYNKLYRETDEIITTYLSLSKLSTEETLLKIVNNQDTAGLILMNLSSDSSFESVRVVVAQHPNTLDIILKKLSFDPSKDVRKAATDTLISRGQAKKSQAVSDDLADR